MANLATVLYQDNLPGPKLTRCVKSRHDLNIVAAASDEFFYVQVPLSKLSLAASTKRNGDVVILDKNILKIGRTVGGFAPKVMILKGHDVVEKAIRTSKPFINVWAGTEAIRKLNIRADDAVSSNELQQKLSILLSKIYRQKSTGISDCCAPAGAWIREIYPFENYVIFEWNGDSYKQAYILDPVTRNVALKDKPVKVVQEFSEVPKGLTTTEGHKAENIAKMIESSAAVPVLPSSRQVSYYTTTYSQEQEFDPINSDTSHAIGAVPGTGVVEPQTITQFGAPSSEINNPPLRTMMNIEEALQMYLGAIANGTHHPAPALSAQVFAAKTRYPNEFSECSIAAGEVIKAKQVKSINVYDFMIWQTRQLNAKKHLKNELEASEFAYVEDTTDPSTWLLQCDTKVALEASSALLEAGDVYIPKNKLKVVMDRMEIFAKKLAKVKSTAVDENTVVGKGKKKVEAEIAPIAAPTMHEAPASTSTSFSPTRPTAPIAGPISHMDRMTGGNPNSGNKKFSIGTRVTSPHGKGRVTDYPSKENVEVTHLDGTVKTFHHSKVTRRD